ncbi:hypothetical protein JW930_05360 [Candidatus Woesearchaeota archaeon]|nr:hypothetical protein [Candidatus Woesearchaeota archaeon]
MGEIVTITYETIFELARKEKTAQELQHLSNNIFELISNYIRDKIHIYKNTKDDPKASEGEKEKVKVQLINARKLVKELIERRQTKVVTMAINNSRLKVPGPEAEETMLPEEKVLYNKTLKNLRHYNKEILLNIVNARLPQYENVENQPSAKEPKIKKDTLMIRFTNYVPKFLGEELEIYGPFEPEDVANLPTRIAELLIKKGRAEEMQALE